jgi:hypothetical protein
VWFLEDTETDTYIGGMAYFFSNVQSCIETRLPLFHGESGGELFGSCDVSLVPFFLKKCWVSASQFLVIRIENSKFYDLSLPYTSPLAFQSILKSTITRHVCESKTLIPRRAYGVLILGDTLV